MSEKIKGMLFGLAVGDALGVPLEFKSREQLKQNPVRSMLGYGSWNQPPGTWSDDSSLAFCLAESLASGYNLDDIASRFINWYTKGYWGAHHKLFDVGGATRFAIERLMQGCSPKLSGGMMEEDNGNGSLMRISPLLFQIRNMQVEDRYRIIKEVSAVTHAHFRSVFSCFILLEIALNILNGEKLENAYFKMQGSVSVFAEQQDFNKTELDLFSRILKHDIKALKEKDISSGGYVLNTLEASLYCILNTDNYAEAVLKAVNLGGDTDTTACVTGALAGLHYGYEAIPESWISVLARKEDIQQLSIDLFNFLKP